jgi:error-prone DNA polymerase
LRARARISRPTLKRLGQLGAFDELNRTAGRRDTATRADIVHHLDKPPVRPVPRRYEPIEGQLALPLGDLELRNLKTRLPEPTTLEKVKTELDLVAVDVSAHLMASYAPLLKELGATSAQDLLSLRSGTEVFVAGIRVATQTPPMRGGRRVVFISLDDGTGCVDCTFFHEAQEKAGPLLFGTRLLLVQGTTRRTGPRGISLQASDAWDLTEYGTLPLPARSRPQPQPVQPTLQLPERPMLVGLNISG